MPEIKHNFTGGKMNKDLDERIVPKDQYRDAMNIQVSTSESSDVGTAQNILGNEFIQNPLHNFAGELNPDAVAVASIADEKDDTLYWFVWSPECDYIFSYKRNATSVETIFRDMNKDTLKFDPRDIVTGINVIDGMIFWTDNRSEPKKINILRCKAGTPANSNAHTKLINDANGITIASNIDIEEKHITVIKRTPLKALKINLIATRDSNKTYSAVLETTSTGFNFGGVTTDDSSNTINFLIGGSPTDPSVGNLINKLSVTGQEIGFTTTAIGDPNVGMTGWQDGTPNTDASGGLLQTNIPVGTKLVFKEFKDDDTPPGLPITDYKLKGTVIDSYPDDSRTNWIDGVTVKIDSIVGLPSSPESPGEIIRYAVDLFDEEEKLFEFKFPRFSYRYKYEDGEYSPFGPFTQVAFAPGAFDYHPRKGYNIGMTNKIKEIELYNFIYNGMPDDVVSVDILFKEEASPNIYVVDTLRPDDEVIGANNDWTTVLNNGFYKIKKETVNSVVPSNQLLRPWDNVPKKALAQDISGSRIIYGNYLQGYNLKIDSNENFVAAFEPQWATFPDTAAGSNKSIKSLREYQLGVVFLDKYGRETPVISSESGTINLTKNRSNLNNRLAISLLGKAPEELTHFKFFIKETASEYYNMAMDRWYDAEDNNIWLAFPSSDRNKLDIDTFLILKKGAESDSLVAEPARYKVLAIENEAPDFIKTTKKIASAKTHFLGTKPIFKSGTTGMPFTGAQEFQVLYQHYYGTSGQALDSIEEDLYVEFAMVGTDQVSKRYKVSSLTNDYNPLDPAAPDLENSEYSFRLDEALGDDVNFINNDTSGDNGNDIQNLAILNIYKYKVENRPQFDGRFFVKIYYDTVFKNEVVNAGSDDDDYSVRDSRKIYSMKNDLVHKHAERHNNYLTSILGVNDIPGAGYSGSGNSNNVRNKYHVSVPFYNDKLIDESQNFGYYSVDAFMSFATYFRRYMNNNNHYFSGTANNPTTNQPANGMPVKILAHLTPSTSGPSIKYPTGGKTSPERWEAQESWHQEFGVTWVSTDPPAGEVGWHGVNTCLSASNFDKAPCNSIHYITHFVNLYPSVIAQIEGLFVKNGYTANWQMMSDRNNVSYGYNKGMLYGNVIHAKSMSRGEAENARDTEVWFVDEGPIAAINMNSDTLDFLSLGSYGGGVVPTYRGRDNTTSYGNGLNVGSIDWSMDLSFGGLQTPRKMEHESDAVRGNYNSEWYKGMFNIGQWNVDPDEPANSKYLDSRTKNFVNRLNPGSQFKFKEDPNQTIYTVGEVDTGRGNLLRHSNVVTLINNAERDQLDARVTTSKKQLVQDFNYWVKGHNYDNDATTLYGKNQGGAWGHWAMAEEVGFNYSKRWEVQTITPKLKWNPMQDGQITGGLDIKITSCSDGGNASSGNTCNVDFDGGGPLKIYVKSLRGNSSSSNAENSVLHVGMALRSYTSTDGTTGTFYDQVNVGGNYANSYMVVYHIEDLNGFFALSLGGYTVAPTKTTYNNFTSAAKKPAVGTDYQFVQVGMNGYSPNSEFNINTMAYLSGNVPQGQIGAVGYTLEFVEIAERETVLSENPAIWETEPKESKDLDIYYEASRGIPINIDSSNIRDIIPVGSTVGGYQVVKHNGDNLVFRTLDSTFINALGSLAFSPGVLHDLEIITPDGLKFYERIDLTWWFNLASSDTSRAAAILTPANPNFQQIKLNPDLFNSVFHLTWHNCFSFGNGVESNRIRDNFNLPFIANGVKASTTLEQEYKEEHRKYGLIYSGLYNSTSGVNNLNQFIQAEKITKDVNPIYGSIQKLHSRDTDLVTLCEDKCLRILANKDAVFNADGNPNLTATENVLGQTIPFSGEYGISTNPESFASENYRVYFTDKIRGSVMRLSKDGLTPISEHGMKDWFRDNLKLSSKLIGSYDDKKEQYNITLKNIFYTNNKIEVVTGSTGSTDQVTAEIGYDGMTGASARFSAPPIPIPTKPPLSGGSEGSGSLGSGSSGGSGGGGGGGY